jgi:hypothetical protein
MVLHRLTDLGAAGAAGSVRHIRLQQQETPLQWGFREGWTTGFEPATA